MEEGNRPRDRRERRGRSRGRELPGELGNEHAVDVIGSGQKTGTGHGESGLPENESVHVENGSDPKIATARGRTATEKTTAVDALDLLTANGKRSENENDGHGHESCPSVSVLSYPSVLLDPKIGNHGRIQSGSGPPKLLSVPHVVERAVRNGEKQPRKRSRQGASAANKQPPAPEAAEEAEARSLATHERLETLPPPPSR